jgi:hypothetical protein
MQTINGYTLFPHQADWSTQPDWEGDWESGIGTGVLGNEQRLGLRALPLHSITYAITAASLQERCRLDARLDQALKSGLAAVPYFGMGSPLAVPANAGGNSVTVQDAVNPWAWAIGDYAVLLGLDDTVYDVLPVTGVAGNVLSFGAGALTYSWVAVWVRPLMFGKFTAQKQQPLSNWWVPLKLTVKQLTNTRSAQVGVAAPAIGVGQQVVGRTNKVS